MRIAKIEDLHCDAGWRDFSFLKITTDDGLVGWSEFMENFGAEGPEHASSSRLGERLIGMDPRPVEQDHRVPARPDAAIAGRHQPAGDRGDRERAGRHQGQGAGHSGLRTAGRADPRSAAALLVALRHLARQLRRPHQGMDRLRSDPLAGRCGARRRRSGAARLQGPEDQHHALRRREADDPHARLQRSRLAGAEHRHAIWSTAWSRR